MTRACDHRTLGRRPTCELDAASSLEAIHRAIGDFGGNVYFVDPNHARASNQHAGTDPAYPLRTMAAGLDKCLPYNGDVVAAMPNGYWQYANPASPRRTAIREAVTVDVPGVRIVGVGASTLGVPWVPPANNATLLTVHALDVTIEGFCFWPFLNTGNTGILTEWNGPPYGENLIVRDCFFTGLGYGIQLDYAWYCRIEDCRFEQMVTAAIHNPSTYGEPDYLTIRRNIFRANAADVNLPDCGGVVIEDNDFLNVTAAIAMTGGSNNLIRRNSIQGDGAGTNNFINLTLGADNLVTGNALSCTVAQYDTTCSNALSGSWVDNRCTDGTPVAPPT